MDDGGEGSGLSKEDARDLAKADWHEDFCERYGWYGDGICDEFCPRPDPDCDPYDPCEGKRCGDRCSVCSPSDPGCVETAVLKYCQPDGSCGAPAPECDDPDRCFGAWRDEHGNCRGPADGTLPEECCVDECPEILCTLYCEHGFETNEEGCPICECAEPPTGEELCTDTCRWSGDGDCDDGGEGSDYDLCDLGTDCSDCGPRIIDDGGDECADEGESCIGQPCCGDLTCNGETSTCLERVPAEGRCVRNSGDECSSDADCVAGGCGGELCFNPDQSSGISTCDCTAPAGVGCGCVDGHCSWYN